MKRPLQLPLAIALALGATNAFALGLGTIHVNSKLNQPLDAEIPVLQGTQGEAEGLLVQLAAAEDFDRVGLNRSRLSVPLEFSLIKNAHGEMVIKVTSKEVVREPFLDFLVEANWPKGRLLREYTVLLDPPVMAPATGAAAVAQAPKATERPATPPPAEKPKAVPPPKAAAVAAAPRPEKAVKPAPAPKAAPAAPAPKAAGANEYTVQEGDTLSGIAREVNDSANINQLMLALLKQNPNAFYKDNINALKRGAILRIPSADQVKAVGSASEAAAMVHSQIEDWRGGAAAKPTLVADTGAAPEPKAKPAATKPAPSTSTASTTTKSGNEHLELVPPKAGKDSVAMNDRPGSGANGNGNAQAAELKSELARTKEALTAREQETGELKSRVKELEDTKGKSDRLITLKDSEIADLQKKLKELQDQSSKNVSKATVSTTPPPAATTPPATTSSTTTPPTTTATPPAAAGKTESKVSKEDIWGNAATGENKPPAATSTPPATGTGSTASSTTPSLPPPSSTTTPPAGSSTTPSSTSATGTTPPAGGTTPPSTTPSTTASTTPSSTTPSSSTTPPSTTGSSTTPTATTTAAAPAKPAATTTPVKTAKTTTQTLPPNTPPWYEAAWVKPAAIGAAALLLLAGLLSMRRRKAAAAVADRGSIAGAFGDSPLREDGGGAAFAAGSEEQALREQLEHDPSNLGLHLELLSLLYAERNVGAFEDAAETMHMHVTDPHQPEWLEAKAMGQELAPHNGLFSEGAGAFSAFDDEAVTARHPTATPFGEDEDIFAPRHDAVPAYDEPPAPHHEPLTPPPATHANTAFDFDLDAGAPASSTPSTTAAEAPFAFDNLPPIDFSKEAQHEFEAAAPAPAPLHVDEDEFAGEDGVGTKLDLAKAYLDMGDPEGARSMLEEVLSEGNDSQKGEARRLMAEIR